MTQRFGKTGVLLVNLGTPDAPRRKEVRRYLIEFLMDRRVVDYNWFVRTLVVRGIIAPLRSGKSAKAYQKVWTENGSPLKYYGYRLAEGVAHALGDEFHVELAMRYQNPSIAAALDKLMQAGVDEIIVFPLFPQYAGATTGSVHEEVMRLLSGKENLPKLHFVSSYYDHPEMIAIFANNARKFDLNSYDHFIFSYHGLPVRQLKRADSSGQHCARKEGCCQQLGSVNQFCYSAQCHATTRALIAQLGLDPSKCTTTFQSRLGPEEWAKPYTSSVIESLAKQGAKQLLVFSPAFVADCLETIEEIGSEYQEEFEEMGGEKIDLVPSLNDNPRWIELVAQMVKSESSMYSQIAVH